MLDKSTRCTHRQYIKTRVNQVSVREITRRSHDACIDMRKIAKFPAYNSPVDWEHMYIFTKDEYFDGVKYAKYRDAANIKIEDNCHIKRKPSKSAEIDDGVHHYDVNLIDHSVETNPSPAVIRQQMAGSLKVLSDNDAALGNTLVNKLEIDKAAEAWKPKPVGQESIIKTKCNWYQIADNKVCHWAQLERYPGFEQRLIVLKTETPVLDWVNTSEAIEFSVGQPISPKIFKP